MELPFDPLLESWRLALHRGENSSSSDHRDGSRTILGKVWEFGHTRIHFRRVWRDGEQHYRAIWALKNDPAASRSLRRSSPRVSKDFPRVRA